ncbi:MAG: hypothetical protein D6788_11210, partial [Planctomycetota bacterium]
MQGGAAAGLVLAVVPGSGLLFALMLCAGIAGGYAARLVRVPRVIGFLLGGVALRYLLHAVLVEEGDAEAKAALAASAGPLRAVSDLALGMILFTIGSVFEWTKLRTGGRALWRQSLAEMATVATFVTIACAAAAWWTLSAAGGKEKIVLAVLLGIAAVATAPAATLFVLQEYEAKGDVTNRILGLVGLNNIFCIVAFYLVFLLLALLGAVRTEPVAASAHWTAMALTTAGSVLLGLLLGLLLSWLYGRLALTETLLLFFASFLLLGAGEPWLWKHQGVSYNFLLAALVSGAVFANVAVDATRLWESLRAIGTPIFAGFFVLAGYNLHLEELRHMGILGGGYVLARTGGKVLG